MLGAEGAEEGVEVVGRGGAVEVCWVLELGFEVGVEFGHARDWKCSFDAEGVVEDSEGGGGLCDFDGVVDVADDAPACGFHEVCSALEAEGRW